jgi:uncharacterized protein YcaQ
MIDLSAVEARSIALNAQGLAAPRPRAPVLLPMFDALGVVQIDSVNVLARSHYLPAWSRLGAYDADKLDKLAYRAPRKLFEYWGHMASLMPVAMWPLFQWRMQRAAKESWRSVRSIRSYKSFLDQVIALVREKGPISAGDMELGSRGRGGWWGWSDAKRAVEWLFWSGQVTTATRRGFERLYDLPERVLPRQVLATAAPSQADAQLELMRVSARALGIATETDLRDYFRLPPADARKALHALVDSNELQPARVEGWPKHAYVHRDAKPVKIDRDHGTLLSPFDNLIWTRDRTERLFGMRYRIEIYTPEPKRVHGYYVLPFLYGDTLAARVDLKADRAARALLVQAAHAEPGATQRSLDALAGELRAMARWLTLDGVTVFERGDLAAKLKKRHFHISKPA